MENVKSQTTLWNVSWVSNHQWELSVRIMAAEICVSQSEESIMLGEIMFSLDSEHKMGWMHRIQHVKNQIIPNYIIV